MKKRVRIYKAEDGIGKVANPLSNFISKAQAGMQQQTDQQQILMQVVSALAPVEQGGQGADPQSVYQMLAQKYGQEAANQLINIAAQYLQQYTQQESPQTAQSTQQPMSDLAAQEDLMDAERRRQAMMEDERMSSEDDMFMDDLLYGEAKYGAELNKAKRKLVKSTVKLAKKQLGDAVRNEQETADSTDILNGRNKKVTGFLNSVKNNVELYNVEKQAEQFADAYFSQFGGAINPELYKYVYGGNDPSIPNLTRTNNDYYADGGIGEGISALNSTGDKKLFNRSGKGLFNKSRESGKGLFNRSGDGIKQSRNSQNLLNKNPNTPGGFDPNLRDVTSSAHGYNYGSVPEGWQWGTDAEGWESSYLTQPESIPSVNSTSGGRKFFNNLRKTNQGCPPYYKKDQYGNCVPDYDDPIPKIQNHYPGYANMNFAQYDNWNVTPGQGNVAYNPQTETPVSKSVPRFYEQGGAIDYLTQAQTGLTVTDKWGNTKQLTQEEIDYWNQQSALDSNLRLTDLSFASEAPGTNTNTNNDLSDQQQLFLNAGKLAGYPNYYNPNYYNPIINRVPYFSDNLFGSMIPYNKGRWKNVMGQPTYAGTNLPFTGNLFGKDMAGWSVTKERLGPGAKKYTFRPEFDQQADNASDLEKERRGLFGGRDNDGQGPFSNLREKFSYALKGAYEPQDSGRRSKGKLSNFFSRNKKAQDGLQTYQGNATGSSVNTQLNDMPVLKPKTSKEAWAASEPEVRKAWGLGPSPSDRQDQDWEASMYSIKEFDPKNINTIANLGMNALSYFGEQSGIADRRAQKDMADQNAYLRTAGAQEPLISYTDLGTYDINAAKVLAPHLEGYEGVMGRGTQAKYGGNIMAHGGTAYPQRFGSLAIYPTAMGGNDIDQYIGKKDVAVKDSLSAVPKSQANLEAEGGETAYGDINGDGFPEHYKITGPRHTEGGVPLNLPDGTFIFSDTRSMKITDCNILKMFNKPCGKGGFTPATLAKPYDINKYRKILQDPESDVLDKKTAELMIKQSVLKLGALALAQESKKGFPQGIPEVARPYMEAMGIKDEDLLPKEQVQQQGTPEEMQMMQSVEEEGMPPVDQMAMQQEDMSGMPMEGMMSYGGTSKRTLRKAAQGLSKDPCPEGMVYDPIYGCIPAAEKHMKEYSPEQINKYFQNWEKVDSPFMEINENIKEDYWNRPQSPFIRKRLTDTKIPYIETAPNQYVIPNEELTPEQKRTLFYINEESTLEKLRMLNELGVSPDEWMDLIPKLDLDEKNPNVFPSQKQNEQLRNLYQNMDDMYEERLQDCPCRKKEFVNNQLKEVCVPCEQMPMAAYGMEMGGYDMPFAQNTFARGGQLDRYQSKGEVKTSPKSYRKEDLPADAVIKSEKDAWNLKEGDFVLQSDGTYRKVTNVKFDPRKVAVDTGTQKQSVIDFMAKSPENVEIIKRANAIIEKALKEGKALRGHEDANGRFIEDKTSNGIKLLGNLNLSFQDRIILSRALNSNKDFGTNKYIILEQGYTPQYTGKGAFTSGFTPEDYEKRFIFEKARGAGNTDDEAFAIVDQVYADPALKAKFRRDYLNMLGVSNVPANDEELLKPDFYKTRYSEVTKGMENVLARDFARPSMGDDALAGFEHFDAFGFSPAIGYETDPLIAEQEKQKKDLLDPYAEQEVLNVPVPDYAPWWLQDTLKTAGAFGRMLSREDQYPTPVFANYGEQYGPMLNPDREIASSKEDASKILGQLASFAGPQNYIGAATAVAGQSARTAGDILSKYNDANVQLARQDIYSNNQIQNIGREKRREIVDKNKRETDLMKAKKQNTRLADMKYLEDSLISAITNRMKTSAVNAMTPEYNVDPSTGGYVYRTGTTRTPNPTKDTELKAIAQSYRDAQWNDDAAAKLALAEYNAKYAKGADNTAYPAEAILNLYNRREGGAIPKAQSGLTKYAPSALRSFLGLSDDLVQGAQHVLPLGSNIPVSLENLQGITDINDYVNLIDPTVPENIPLQAGYGLDALKKLYEQYNTLTDKGIDYLSKIPGMSTLGTLTNAAMPVKFNLHSPILTGDKLTSMGSIKPDVVTDEVIYLLAKKREAGMPLDANEEMVLFTFKDKAANLLKNPPKVNKEDLNKVTPGTKPAETAAVIDPITQEARDTAAIKYFQRTYDSLMPFEKLFIDGQIGIGATAEAEKAAAKALKKPRATRKTKAKEEAAPESKVTAESPDLDKLRDQVAMEAYGEPYSELPTLAKKIVDNRVSMKINGEPEAPFKDGGAYIMGSTVFPFMFY